MKKLWIFLVSKLDYFWGSFLYKLGPLLQVKVQNGNIVWGR